MATAYFKQVFVAVDQLVNALLGGYADETLSSFCHRENPRMAAIIDTILFFDPDHCRRSYESERLRTYHPPSLRGTK